MDIFSKTNQPGRRVVRWVEDARHLPPPLELLFTNHSTPPPPSRIAAAQLLLGGPPSQIEVAPLLSTVSAPKSTRAPTHPPPLVSNRHSIGLQPLLTSTDGGSSSPRRGGSAQPRLALAASEARAAATLVLLAPALW